MTMRAYELGAQNGLSSLRMVERRKPVAGFGEVLIKVRLACLNNRDIQLLEGRYSLLQAEGRIPCSDGVGEVVAIGEGVAGINCGERAIFPHFTGWLDGAFDPAHFSNDCGVSCDGWLADYIVVPAPALVRVPDDLSDEKAATLATAALTAWNCVVEYGQVKAGDTVLVLGTGGVALWALQIAKAQGARVAITSSSDEKLARALAMGADIGVNYRSNPEWATKFLELNGGKGADIIVETGGQESLQQSVAATAPNARIGLIAVGGMPDAGLSNFGMLILRNVTVRGITGGNRAMLTRLLKAVTCNDFSALIDTIFTYEEADKALAHLNATAQFGKVAIRVS